MRFIGNKEFIITDIIQLLEEKNLYLSQLTLFDAFCGTGAISDALKNNFKIISNDMLKWTTIYTKGRLYAPNCTFEKLGFDPFAFFNSNNEMEKGFFYKNYSPAECDRMYFSIKNKFQRRDITYQDILTNDILTDICCRLTGQNHFTVDFDNIDYNKGRLVKLEFNGGIFYISISEKEIHSRNSFFQSFPTALVQFHLEPNPNKGLYFY
jgi:hypothetical protein